MTPQTTGKAAGASRTIWRIASRHKPFAQLGNAMLRDERLTLEARGALAFILSFPEDWRFSETWFCANANVGRDKARRIIRELLEHGYCWRRQARQSGGTLGAGEYIFTDEPGHASLAGTTKDNITWPTVDASS